MSYKIRYSEQFTWYKLRKMVCRYFAEEARSGMKVLEIGCNVGINFFMLNDLFHDAGEIDFYGVDISPNAIKDARKEAEKLSLKNCFFVEGDAEKLKYDDNSFDIVICTEVLEHLPHPEVALKEIHRVLKWGGVAIITTPNRDNIFKKVFGWMKEMVESDVEKVDPHRMLDGSYGHISVLSSKELIQKLKDMGFKIKRIEKESIVYGLPFFDRHQILFGLLLIADVILDYIPYTYDFSWGVVLKIEK